MAAGHLVFREDRQTARTRLVRATLVAPHLSATRMSTSKHRRGWPLATLFFGDRRRRQRKFLLICVKMGTQEGLREVALPTSTTVIGLGAQQGVAVRTTLLL